MKNVHLKGYSRVTEQNGMSLMKLRKDMVTTNLDDYYNSFEMGFMDRQDVEQEKASREAFPTKSLYSLVDIQGEGDVVEHARFLTELKEG